MPQQQVSGSVPEGVNPGANLVINPGTNPDLIAALGSYFGWMYEGFAKPVEFYFAYEQEPETTLGATPDGKPWSNTDPDPNTKPGHLSKQYRPVILCRGFHTRKPIAYKGGDVWPMTEVQALWDKTVRVERYPCCPSFVAQRSGKDACNLERIAAQMFDDPGRWDDAGEGGEK